MPLSIYNSRSQSLEVFTPSEKEVKIYWCGPTVYDTPHLGNVRSAIVADLLFRITTELYPIVKYVRNITDIDDKIMNRAIDEKISMEVLIQKTIEQFHNIMASLNVLSPNVEPRVTQSIPAIISLISKLLEKNHAYISAEHVLFDVPSWSTHGELGAHDLSMLDSGHRIEVADYKRSPHDFILWKPSLGDQPGWSSPWGYGRPGWHIECSAMIAEHLGDTIDIHGGGHDLKFPHHDCEISQSGAATGKPLANYWMHNGMLTVNGQKMSKSTGNFILVDDALTKASGEVIRYLLISGHYRQPLDWTWDKLESSKNAWNRLNRARQKIDVSVKPKRGESFEALLNDMNTPNALAILHSHASKILSGQTSEEIESDFLFGGEILGILNQKSKEGSNGSMDVTLIDGMVSERKLKRDNRQWAEADLIREKLFSMGIEIEDTPQGTNWRAR